ncbi:hypothetical protein [Microbacterium sp.]|uniref:hypothetical protein n=1 Tax=Microbacterium sp. TaxID=51671 RepID=UPI002733AC7E|nr:hypothetical protein [Microbacterium sp.]MDP3953164.1 hypothetical protein [Microbacterium sp.]
MTDYCDFSDLPAATCSHCHPPVVHTTQRQAPGEKADNGYARAIFKAMVLEVRPDAAVLDPGNADELTVDGTRVWVKATLEPEGGKASFQFHDGARMLAVSVDYIALVNTALGEVQMIGKADADAEARLQLEISTSGRITLKPKSPRVQPHVRTVGDVF